MPNSYFQFKQFVIHQEHCAMKVTTDGCLFGAWVAASKAGNAAAGKHVLDIGTGTGLLSLMYAQKHPHAQIDAIEIDEAAAQQAADNFAASPWQKRLQLIHSDIKDYRPSHPYDTIISNPPFYENQLSSGNAKKNMAHHSSSIGLE